MNHVTVLEAVADAAREWKSARAVVISDCARGNILTSECVIRLSDAEKSLEAAIADLDAVLPDAGEIRMPSPWTSGECPKVGDIIQFPDGSRRIVRHTTSSFYEYELL